MRLQLLPIALVNAALHLIALAATYFGIRPGSPMATVADRLEYLGGHSWLWVAAWVAWMLSAGAMAAYTVVLARSLPQGPASLAIPVALVAFGIDLSCDCVFIGVFPWLASRPGAVDLFLTVERITMTISLFVANGLYTVATLLLVLSLRRDPAARSTTGLGLAVAMCGFLLSAAGFSGVPWHAQWAAVLTIVGYAGWSLWVAWLRERGAATR